MLEAYVNEGPRLVTRRGEEKAVLVRVEEWRRLCEAPRPSIKDLLLTDSARVEIDIPARGGATRRPNPFVAE